MFSPGLPYLNCCSSEWLNKDEKEEVKLYISKLRILLHPSLIENNICATMYKIGNRWEPQFSSIQFSRSVVSDFLRPHGLQYARPPCPLPTKFTQTHVHWVGDAIQPSHPLSFPSPTFSLSQHQGLFQLVSSLHQVAKVLEFQLQHQSFQWIFRTDFLNGLIGLIGSLCSPRVSQASSPASQFKNMNSLALSFLYSPTLTPIHDYWKNRSLD